MFITLPGLIVLPLVLAVIEPAAPVRYDPFVKIPTDGKVAAVTPLVAMLIDPSPAAFTALERNEAVLPSSVPNHTLPELPPTDVAVRVAAMPVPPSRMLPVVLKIMEPPLPTPGAVALRAMVEPAPV